MDWQTVDPDPGKNYNAAVSNGSMENEDPENEDPKTEDLRKRRPTKTKTPYENEDPPAKTKTYENEDPLRERRPLRNFYDFNFSDIQLISARIDESGITTISSE